MMLFCVVEMRKMGCSTPCMTEVQTAGQTRASRITTLEDQLAASQSELAALRAAEERRASSSATTRSPTSMTG